MSSARIKETHWQMGALALRLREEIGLALTDPVPVRSILKKKGIIAVFRPLSGSFSGMAVKAMDKTGTSHRFMLVNTAQSLGKERFTACHELYHLLFQERFEYSANNAGTFDSSSQEEYNADVFAASLLLPEPGINQIIPFREREKDAISLDTILALEQNYLCSRTTLLRMLKTMNLISSDIYNKYSIDVMHRASEYGYDLMLYKPSNKSVIIGDYNLKARALLCSGKISNARYQELLDDMGLDKEEDYDGD